MRKLSAYSGWIGYRNIGDEAIFIGVKELLPELKFSDIDHVEQQDVIVYGGGTIFPSIISRNPDYRDDAFTAAIGVGVRSPMFWNRTFSPLDFGYYTGSVLNKNGLDINIVDHTLFSLTKFFDSFWTYNKTLTKRDFEAVRSADLDFLGVRGPLSSDLLSQYDIEHEIIGDTALTLEPSSYDTENRPMIAVTLRDNTYGWAPNDYHETVVEFCQRNANKYEFVFLPFWPPDIEVCLNAARQVPGARFEDYCSCIDVQGVLDEISRCNLLIGDKLHSNILSACSYTPFISLEYRPKNRDFAESVSMEEFNIRTDEVDVDWLENRLVQIENNEEIVVELERAVEGHRESLRSFSRRIATSVEEM